MPLRIEPLERSHKRSAFDCGDQDLNVYLRHTARQHTEMGIIGFFVDAKQEEAANYYRQFGFIPLPDNTLELFLPLATIRQALEYE